MIDRQTSSVIPIIDLNQEGSGEIMVKACREHGFFYIDNRKGQAIPISLVEEVKKKQEEFFALPLEVKEKYAMESSRFQRGYLGLTSTYIQDADKEKKELSRPYSRNESFVFGSPCFFNDVKKTGIQDGNLYPTELGPEFETMIKQYTQSLWKVKDKILAHLAPYLCADKLRKGNTYIGENWKEAFSEVLWALRLLYYPAYKGTLSPHTDFGILTIVQQDQTGGLQIWFEEKWIDVNPIPNTFIVNIGDMLQEWSSGQLKSTRHRVVVDTEKPRYSWPFFVVTDKSCEMFSEKKKGWEFPYRHQTQRLYQFIKYLYDSVENPETCLEGKSPEEIDAFHQEVIQSRLDSSQSTKTDDLS